MMVRGGGPCPSALGPIASGLIGAMIVPLLSTAALGADARRLLPSATEAAAHDGANGVGWLEGIQGQARQLKTRKGVENRPSEARKTFELPFPGRERGGEPPIELYKTERSGELILTDPAPAGLEAARQAGFVIGTSTRLASGTTLVRLGAPGMARDAALRTLQALLPGASVAANEAYTIYTPTVGEADGVRTVIERNRVEPAAPGPCTTEVCFGRALIAWRGSLSACAKSVRIGIIDTSFDLAHPALKDIRAEEAAFLDGETPSPFDWHGTAVLSLLAGRSASGTPGLVPDATFLLAAAFRSDAAGNASTDTVRLLAALSWLDQRGVDLVNMSFTGPRDPAIERAIANMRKKGVVFVAAAGNLGPMAEPSYPAAYPQVIAVTAVNSRGEGYRHANRGDYIDVAAPGVDVLTALPKAQQGYRTGTSFAVPFVTAIAATRVGQLGPEPVALGGVGSQLVKTLDVRDLGPPGRDPIYGAGLALAPDTCAPGEDAVAAARSGPSSPAIAPPPEPSTFIGAGAAGFSN